MRRLVNGVIPITLFFFITSCCSESGSSVKLSSNDSMSIYNAITTKSNIAAKAVYSYPQKRLPISIEDARNYATDYYSSAERLPIVNENNKYIKAFNIDATEIDQLKGFIGADKFLGIRVYFGINGREPGTGKPLYTLILVGRKKFGDKEEEDHLVNNQLFDYVLPCPDNCPKSGDILH